MRQFLFIVLFVSSFVYANSIELTPKEKLFIQENQNITLGVGKGWEPFVIVKGDEITGFDADILKLINKATGANFVFEVGVWKDIPELVKKKKIYGLMDIIKTKDRDRFLNYSDPYSVIEYSIATSNMKKKNLIRSKDDYKNLTFGYQKGLASHLAMIKELDLTKTIGFDSLSDLFIRLKDETIDIVPIHSGYNYLLSKNGLPQLEKTEHYFKKIDVFIGIHKDYPEAISIINKALQSIEQDIIIDLRKKWSIDIHTDRLIDKKLDLTTAEKELIKNNTFNLCLQYDIPNRNHIENGELKGSFGLIYNEISKLSGLKFNYVIPESYDDLNKKVASNTCDAVTVIGTEQKRFNNIVASDIIKASQMVAVGRTSHMGKIDFDEVVFYANFLPFIKEMKKHYPNATYKHIKKRDEIATLLENNNNHFFIVTLANANDFIQEQGYKNFKIIETFSNIYHNLSTGINDNNPLLLSIINKSIEHIGQEKIDKIFEETELKSYTINQVNYQWLWYLVAVLVFVGIILVYKYIQNSQKHKNKEKESKNELEFLSGLAQLSPWSFDVPTMTFKFSTETQKIYGLTDTPYMKAEEFIAFVHKDDRDFIQQKIQQAIENDVHDPVKYRFVRLDGEVVYIFTKWEAIYNKGIFVKAKGYNQDITEQTMAEQSQQVLVKNAALGEMLGNIAHQWRQPLSVITASASGCLVQKQMGFLEDKNFEILMNEIIKSSRYLSNTINTFSNFLKDNKELKDTIKESVILSQSFLGKNNIELKDCIDYEEELIVKMVENELVQVLINFINNANDILVEKQISEAWVKLSLEKTDQEIKIIVEDNGGGIPYKILPKIFEPYFTTKHKSQGTGLGLYMSHKIITESMQGKIYARNTAYGALFTIELPLK